MRAGGGYNEDSRVRKEVLGAVRRRRGSHGDQEVKTAKVSGEPGPDPEDESGALRRGQARGRGSRSLEACPPQPVAGSQEAGAVRAGGPGPRSSLSKSPEERELAGAVVVLFPEANNSLSPAWEGESLGCSLMERRRSGSSGGRRWFPTSR